MGNGNFGKKVKKLFNLGKNTKKVVNKRKIFKKGAAAGMGILEKVSPEKAENLETNLGDYQEKIDEKSVALEKFLDDLQVKFDAKIGNKIEDQIVLVEQWIAEHGGNAVERFLSEHSEIGDSKITPQIQKLLKSALKKIPIEKLTKDH